METMLLQTSLIAAFFAGIVALFAPCCITFLLPAYLGSVFKEKEKVLLMTFLFGLGIFIVMLPAVLGVALLSQFLFMYHNQIYLAGGIVLLLVSGITFLGIKMPIMLHMGNASQKKPDALSIFTLGIFSGVTSACCAPVLIGILTLTFMSPSFIGALGIGAVYVLGMVTPLLIISFLLAGKMDSFLILKKTAFSFTVFHKSVAVIWSNLIASIIFAFTGILILYLNANGKLGMGETEGFTKMISDASQAVNTIVGNNSILNIVFVIALIVLLYILYRRR